MTDESVVESDCAFVHWRMQPHTEESFLAAGREFQDFIDSFVKRHGIGVVVGFVAPYSGEPGSINQGTMVVCNHELARTVIRTLAGVVQKAEVMSTINNQSKN